MAEEVHLVGSPLDLYLEELGGEFAGLGQGHWETYGTRLQGLDLKDEAESTSRVDYANSSLPSLTSAQYVADQMVDIFESAGLFSSNQTERRVHWSISIESLVVRGVGFLVGFSLLTATWLKKTKLQYWESCLCAVRGALFCATSFSIMKIWKEAVQVCCQCDVCREARKFADIAADFWTDSSTIIPDLIDCELFPKCSKEGHDSNHGSLVEAALKIDATIVGLFASLCARMGSLIRSCATMTCSEQQELWHAHTSALGKVGVRSSLLQIWEFQSDLLSHCIDLVQISKHAIASNVLHIGGSLISDMHSQLMQQIALKQSLLLVHQTVGHLPFHGNRTFRESRIRATLRYSLAVAANSFSDISSLVEDNDKMQRLIDQLAPHLDAMKKLLQTNTSDDCPPSDTRNTTCLQPMIGSELGDTSTERRHAFEPQPKDITFVHEARGDLGNDAALEAVLRGDVDMGRPGNDPKQMLRGCLSELQEILAARCPAVKQCSVRSHGLEIVDERFDDGTSKSHLMKWETEGTGPEESFSPKRPVRQKPVHRGQDTLNVLQALESCLLTRARPGFASDGLELEG